MEDIRKNRYLDKLSNLKKYYNLFNEWFEKSEIQKNVKEEDFKTIFSIYHAFQLIIDIIVDISAMIVKDINGKSKGSYDNFKVLQDEKIIKTNIFNFLNEMTGLRNRIVHDYNGLIDSIALESMNKKRHLITQFQEEIITWLKAQ